MRDVAACGAEEQVAAMVGEHIDAQARATCELARFTALRTSAVAVGGLVPIVLILAAGSWLMQRGVSSGAILGALTYVAQGVHPALQTLVRGLGNTGLWLFVTLARIVEETEAPADARPPRRSPAAEPHGYDLVLRGVTFGYGRAAEPVIGGLDLVAGEGDHVAVVGGAGKSTLARLVAGLLEPQHGAVLVGGVPIAELDAAAAARQRVLIPRISSALRARRVLVLDGGQAIAGRHEELLRHSELYRELVGHWDAAPARRAVNGAHVRPPGLLVRIGRALAGRRQ
ncbi:MAG: ATP-binding cassette domain-containing protein [Solirubrobacteraceae bacterium]